MEIPELFSRENYHEIRAAWSAYIQQRPEGHNWNHLLYTLVRGKDPFTAFKPLVNPIKIENNNGKASNTLATALYNLTRMVQSHKLKLDALANPTDPKYAYRIKTITSNKYFLSENEKTSFHLNEAQTQHLLSIIESVVAQLK